MYVCVGTEWHMCEGQSTTCSNWLAPSTTWVWGIEFRSPGLVTKSLYLLNNLTSPTSDFFGLFVCFDQRAIFLRNCWCLLATLGYTGELEGRLYQMESSLGGVLDSTSQSPVRTGLRHFCTHSSLFTSAAISMLIGWLLPSPSCCLLVINHTLCQQFLKDVKRELCLVQ